METTCAAAAPSPVTCVVVGAGNRGHGYALFALEQPARLRVVAAAEPSEFRRERMRREHDIPHDLLFDDWQSLVSHTKARRGRKPIANFAIISTQDRDHRAPACALAQLGYHILVEKPLATSLEDCEAIVKAAEVAGVMLGVCHVLRYTPSSRRIKELIETGAIGKVQHIQHTENVGFFHFAHSFVRGNWAQEATSTFSLLAKSCHDIDLVRYWAGSDCSVSRISSFGSLVHFKASQAPPLSAGAERCTECALSTTCPYSAVKIYQEPAARGHKGWPLHAVVPHAEPDVENVAEALRTGPYGRCVYRSDNDVCDNQVVNFQFTSGAVASFSMIACTEKLCVRDTIISGSHGQIFCSDGETVEVFDFRTRKRTLEHCSPPPMDTQLTGHGGADWFLIDSFVRAVALGDASLIATSGRDALASHVLVFAAERARREDIVLSL